MYSNVDLFQVKEKEKNPQVEINLNEPKYMQKEKKILKWNVEWCNVTFLMKKIVSSV